VFGFPLSVADPLCLCVSERFSLQLLERDPQKRLGGGPRDAQEVKEHEYFAGIDWDALLRKEVPATYKPIIVSWMPAGPGPDPFVP